MFAHFGLDFCRCSFPNAVATTITTYHQFSPEDSFMLNQTGGNQAPCLCEASARGKTTFAENRAYCRCHMTAVFFSVFPVLRLLQVLLGA